MSKIEIRRPANEAELEQAQKAKNEAWGFLNLKPGEGSIKPIYENYPEGFLTAFVDGEGAGNFTLMILITLPSFHGKSPPQVEAQKML